MDALSAPPTSLPHLSKHPYLLSQNQSTSNPSVRPTPLSSKYLGNPSTHTYEIDLSCTCLAPVMSASIPLPPMPQACTCLRGSFLSLKSQFRCHLPREALPSHPDPLSPPPMPSLHPETVPSHPVLLCTIWLSPSPGMQPWADLFWSLSHPAVFESLAPGAVPGTLWTLHRHLFN
jgi:hypothetical protein